MAPWLIMMFVGAMDWGFYAYSLIATEAAARVGALYASTNTTATADTNAICDLAIGQLRRMANVGNSLTHPCASGNAVSATAPVGISVSSVSGASSADGGNAVSVSITYQTPIMIPMVMSGTTVVPKQITITRTVQMRMRG